MFDSDLSAACYLYNLHMNSGISPEEKIKCVFKKYKKEKLTDKWNTLYNFFANPIYVKTSYYCETYSNFGTGTIENRYIKNNITDDEAIKGNVYFYILLMIIGEDNDIVAHTANYITSSPKTSKYLTEYGKLHNLQYDYNERAYGKYFIRIMYECVVSENGHNIYKCIELPI